MVEETRLPCGAEVCLEIPHFEIYIKGDLKFYSDNLGKHNSSPQLCYLGDVSHDTYNNVSNLNKGDFWRIDTMQETSISAEPYSM